MASSRTDSMAEEYYELSVLNHVIRAGQRTINLSSIATITVGKYDRQAANKSRAQVAGLALAVGGLVAMAGAGLLSPVGIGMLVTGALTLLFGLRPSAEYHLIISTNDGVKTLFRAPGLDVLQEIKAALDDRLEHREARAHFAVNFQTGRIEHQHHGRTDTLASRLDEAHISAGSFGHRFDEPRIETQAAAAAHAQAGAHAEGANLTHAGMHAQGHGGHAAAGQRLREGTSPMQPVDYSFFEPYVQQWQAYLADTERNPAIDARLEEFARLMRSGTPRPEDKSRLRQIGKELLGQARAYPDFAALIADVMKLVA